MPNAVSDRLVSRSSLVGVALILTSCAAAAAGVAEPLPDTARRPTPLSFGLHVTPDPAENPIEPPERFTGYHVGTDFEVSVDELDVDVPVYAICSGKVQYAGFAEGYGGLVIQHCRVSGEDVSVLYGHLSLEDLPDNGDSPRAGDPIGLLAEARSRDSDGNRKHLHLGIHRGAETDMRGYVQTEEEIANFIDPLSLVPASALLPLPELEPYWQTDELAES